MTTTTSEINLQQAISCANIKKKKTNFVLFSSLKGISYQVQVHLTVQFTKVLYVSPIPSPAFCFFLFPYLDTIFLQSRLSIVFLLLTVRTAVQSLKILTKFLTVKIQVTTSKIQSDLCFLSWNTLRVQALCGTLYSMYIVDILRKKFYVDVDFMSY